MCKVRGDQVRVHVKVAFSGLLTGISRCIGALCVENLLYFQNIARVVEGEIG
jgi:hypothetical protein